MFDFSTEETYRDGQIIYKEGNAANWIYVIESGAVELSKKCGEEKVVVDILKPGDVFGKVSFFIEAPRTVTAKAVGTAMLGGIDRSMLDRELKRKEQL
jgi:CRP-like cAMP-binding protein